MDYMDFNQVADDLGQIGQVMKMLVPAVEKAKDEIEDQAEGEAKDEDPKGKDPLGSPDQLDSEAEVPMDKNMDAE